MLHTRQVDTGEGRISMRTFYTKPNGAYKLLTHVMYGSYEFMDLRPRRIVELHSVRKMARILGTQPRTVRTWLNWLEDQGYIESLQSIPDSYGVKFKVRQTNL